MDFNHEEAWRKAQESPPENFALANRNLADLIDVGVDPFSNLIGNRWLTREGSLFVVAPSGHGKSSFCIQCMINWSMGRIAFGLKPSRPLRILMVESEDDDADNKAFVQVIRTMNLSQAQMDLLAANTRIEFRRDLTGERFFRAIDAFLSQYKADILIINPLTGFCTVDLKDEIGMNDWLRNRLNSIMVKRGCAPMIVAHMPKGQIAQIQAKEWYEWMYVLSGCVTLTNWARAILVFIPSKTPGTYRFITAKRPSQSGWVEPEYYFAHSKKNVDIDGDDFEIIQWVPATESQIKEAAPEPKEKKFKLTADLIHQNMSALGEYTRDSFRYWCKETFNLGRESADILLSAMVHNGLIQAIKGEGKGAARLTTFRKIEK
jgi:AAA domain